MSDLLLFFAVGKVSIMMIQKWYTMSNIKFPKYLDDLTLCQLCLGTWVYFGLSLIMGITFVDFPVVGNLITGIGASWLMYVFSVGWSSLYQNMIVE